MEPLVYTFTEAAQVLQVSTRTVRRMVKANRLPVVYFGDRPMVPRRALEAWLEEQALLEPGAEATA